MNKLNTKRITFAAAAAKQRKEIKETKKKILLFNIEIYMANKI